MMNKTHKLQINENWLELLLSGDKTCEVRKHDKDYQIGDTIQFYDPQDSDCWYEQKQRDQRTHIQTFKITHILPASVFSSGLKSEYSVLSLVKIINDKQL